MLRNTAHCVSGPGHHRPRSTNCTLVHNQNQCFSTHICPGSAGPGDHKNTLLRTVPPRVMLPSCYGPALRHEICHADPGEHPPNLASGQAEGQSVKFAPFLPGLGYEFPGMQNFVAPGTLKIKSNVNASVAPGTLNIKSNVNVTIPRQRHCPEQNLHIPPESLTPVKMPIIALKIPAGNSCAAHGRIHGLHGNSGRHRRPLAEPKELLSV